MTEKTPLSLLNLPDPSPRDHMVNVRLNDYERAVLETASSMLGHNQSVLLRALILGPLLQQLAAVHPEAATGLDVYR